MGCKTSKPSTSPSSTPSPTSISPTNKNRTTTTTTIHNQNSSPKKDPLITKNNDRYCRCSPDQLLSQSFVCPVCRKIRLTVKKDARQAQRKQRKASMTPAASLAPRNLRRRTSSHDDSDSSSNSNNISPRSSSISQVRLTTLKVHFFSTIIDDISTQHVNLPTHQISYHILFIYHFKKKSYLPPQNPCFIPIPSSNIFIHIKPGKQY
jgi:hypothetical protein